MVDTVCGESRWTVGRSGESSSRCSIRRTLRPSTARHTPPLCHFSLQPRWQDPLLVEPPVRQERPPAATRAAWLRMQPVRPAAAGEPALLGSM